MRILLDEATEQQYKERKQWLTFYTAPTYGSLYKGKVKAHCKANLTEAIMWLRSGHSIKVKGAELTKEQLENRRNGFKSEFC